MTEHYSRALGVTVPELRNLFKPLKPIEKIHFSCMGDEGFQEALKDTGRDQIILCGIEDPCLRLPDGRGPDARRQAGGPWLWDAVSSCSAANRAAGVCTV